MSRPNLWRLCARKKRYRSQSDATWSATRVKQNGAQVGSERAHSYYCDICRGWHVGRDRKQIDDAA